MMLEYEIVRLLVPMQLRPVQLDKCLLHKFPMSGGMHD